jgi:hypothetical protein
MRSRARLSSSLLVRILSSASPPSTSTPTASSWLLATPWTSPLGLSSHGIHVDCAVVVSSFGTLLSLALTPVLRPSSGMLGNSSGGLFSTLAAFNLTLSDSHSCALWLRSPHFRQGPSKVFHVRTATCGSASRHPSSFHSHSCSGCTRDLLNRVVRYL